MAPVRFLTCLVPLLVLACSSAGSSPSTPGGSNSSTVTAGSGTTDGDDPVAACSTASGLAGVPYDVTRSKFAFGSSTPPVAEDAGSLVRYTGPDGVVAIFTDGSESASLDADAPESSLGGWSGDGSTLTAHVEQYWEAMGVPACQILRTDITSGGSGGGSSSGGTTTFTPSPSTVGLVRGISGIVVAESTAFAQFDVDDQTTSEGFYWPAIPADVVSAALALDTQLASPTALAAYKAKLPANAQGDGAVFIHHTEGSSTAAFQAVATYDVEPSPLGESTALSFDANGNPVTLP
jgi:hypothetical protein